MVKKSKKSKSKRTPLRQKYKILKKVKEHHRKKAKEAKKLGKSGKARIEKDPGIPNAWPFREQELQALEARRAKALEEQEQKQLAKKERARLRKLGVPDQDVETMAKLATEADRRGLEFEKTKAVRSDPTSSPPEGSRRAFYKEFHKVIEAADVVIQVLDARDPLGSRCLDVERLVLKAGPTKRIVLVLNKIDLVPREAAESWLTYLREELPTIPFKCSTQQQRLNLGRRSSTSSKHSAVPISSQTSECLGAETLVQLLKNFSRNQKLKTAITVGVVGFPNVGKSSLINSLKRTRVASVGAAPGITKVMQEIHLDKHVKLLDCPGIVFASSKGDEASVTLRNCTKIEQLEDPYTPVKEILKLCSEEKLMAIYRISQFSTVDEFLQKVALVRGKLKKGGVANTLTAARAVLYDWNQGKIPYCSFPPKRHTSEHLESSIVGEWSKEFNVNHVYKDVESGVIANLSHLSASLHSELAFSQAYEMDAENDDSMVDSEAFEMDAENDDRVVGSQAIEMDAENDESLVERTDSEEKE